MCKRERVRETKGGWDGGREVREVSVDTHTHTHIHTRARANDLWLSRSHSCLTIKQ